MAAITRPAGSEEELKALCATLRSQEEILFRNVLQLDEIAQTLTAPGHTLGLVFVLNVRANALTNQNTPLTRKFMEHCRALLLNADRAQVAFAPLEFSRVCSKYLSFAMQAESPLHAVRPLVNAAYLLQPAPTHFTPVHPMALLACILAKCYHAAAPLVEQPLVHVDAARTAVGVSDVLLHHYYGGIALVGLKRHKAALASFQLVIAAPTVVVNSIIVEAHKKWLLCWLIAHKRAPVLPKYCATVIGRHAKSGAAPYTELAAAFTSRDRVEFEKTVAKHAAVFEKDSNMGLVKQCAVAFTKCAPRRAAAAAAGRRRPRMQPRTHRLPPHRHPCARARARSPRRDCIERLTRTYVTLSLADIAASAGLSGAAEAGAMILQMVEGGEIAAQIDRVHSMASFDTTAGAAKGGVSDAAETKAALDARLEQAMQLTQKLRALHDELAGDANYIQKTTERADRAGGRWAAGERGDDVAMM